MTRCAWNPPKLRRFCKNCSRLWEYALAPNDPIGAHRCIYCGGPLQRERPTPRRSVPKAKDKRKKSLLSFLKKLSWEELKALEGADGRELTGLLGQLKGE